MLIASIMLLSNAAAVMADNENTALLNTSKQLLVITSNDWKSNKGQLQRFERNDVQSTWQSVGENIPVVLGNAGMGWSKNVTDLKGPKKQEGDKRTPAGMFLLGQAFGFAHTAPVNTKLLYTAITASTVCINDSNSRFYNKIVDTEKILQPDWKTAEQMRNFDIYEQGVVVRYNNRKPVAGAGSCIFMHNWRNPNEGTSGCIALGSENLKDLIAWLDSNKRPVLILLPKGEYQLLAKSWNLPELG